MHFPVLQTKNGLSKRAVSLSHPVVSLVILLLFTETELEGIIRPLYFGKYYNKCSYGGLRRTFSREVSPTHLSCLCFIESQFFSSTYIVFICQYVLLQSSSNRHLHSSPIQPSKAVGFSSSTESGCSWPFMRRPAFVPKLL